MSAEFRRTVILGGEQVTRNLAERIAPRLGPGDCILLTGDIGAGKTHFARSLIQARLAAAGRIEDVPSPTFTLVQTYWDGTVEIWHADLYRLSDPDQLWELGLDEAFAAAIVLVEWPDRLAGQAPADALHLQFGMTGRPGERELSLSGPADRWAGRLRDLLGEEGVRDAS